MTQDELTASPALQVTLHFELRLADDGPQPGWRASMRGAPLAAPLQFGSMAELIRYLARLELQVPPPRGIR